MVATNYGPGGQQQYGAGRPPAPGASPKGGTTSLPQALQSPSAMPGQAVGGGIGGTTPGGTGGAMAPPPAAPPVPASVPPGAVPPAPPISGGTPATATPPAADPQKQMGDALFHKLMEMISNPSRYNEATDAARKQGMQTLEDSKNTQLDSATADAAKRGVYYGTPLTNAHGNISETFLRGQGDLESGLIKDEAAHRNEDLQTTLNAIFGYGDRQRMDTAQQNDLLVQLINGGYINGADANSLIAQLNPKAG